jgi:hypothetical protein
MVRIRATGPEFGLSVVSKPAGVLNKPRGYIFMENFGKTTLDLVSSKKEL